MSELVHNTKMSVRFLKAFSPEGPWVLTAIVPDGGKTWTETFWPRTEQECHAWIESHQGIKNLYFMVNPALRDLKTKAKKIDVDKMAWLHVDIDPRPGEDIDKERERAFALLQNFRPAPSVILDSGGGYQGFWKLEEPVVITGEGQERERKCEELETYNQQLELLLGGDHCFNLDRIMRLPGTINIPGEKKRKKGRVNALAKALVFDAKLTYPLSAFTAAPRVQVGDGGFTGDGARVKISGNLPRIESVSDLPLSDKTRMLIVQGGDPDDPTKWSSRSELLFHVLCEMVRAGIEVDIMASVIMDPDFLISQSVLDKPRPEQYAARQIQRAQEEAVDPWLRKLNDKHAVIADVGGKCRVITEVPDEILGRPRLSRQSFDDFRNRYRHIKVDVGTNEKGMPIQKPAGSWWLDHPKRRQYETITFAPGREVPDAYNLWRGFACEAIAGDCSKLITHVRDNICSGNEEHFRYMMGWMATAVQHPDLTGQVAVVIRGKQGTGKGVFIKAFGSLFGRHFLQISDPKHLVGSFNSHLRDCVVLFGDEAFFAGDKKHESILKMLVTEQQITFEAKGMDAENGANYVHLLLSSNSDWVVPAGAEERRFFALNCGDERMQDKKYFLAIEKELASGGRQAFLHMLLNYDLKGFDVRTAPKTAALREQKRHSFTPDQAWLHERLVDGISTASSDEWLPVIRCDLVYEDFCNYGKDGGFPRRPSRFQLYQFLAKVFSDPFPPRRFQDFADIMVTDESGMLVKKRMRPYFFEMPTLEAARAMFDKAAGGPFEWPKVDRPPEPIEPTSKRQTSAPF